MKSIPIALLLVALCSPLAYAESKDDFPLIDIFPPYGFKSDPRNMKGIKQFTVELSYYSLPSNAVQIFKDTMVREVEAKLKDVGIGVVASKECDDKNTAILRISTKAVCANRANPKLPGEKCWAGVILELYEKGTLLRNNETVDVLRWKFDFERLFTKLLPRHETKEWIENVILSNTDTLIRIYLEANRQETNK